MKESVYQQIHEAALLYEKQNPRGSISTAYANGALDILLYLSENDERAVDFKKRFLVEYEFLKSYAEERDM